MKIFVLIFLSLSLNTYGQAKNISFALRDVETGKLVSKQNEKDLKILASVSKLFTSYYVLKSLDEDYKYETKIFTNGKNLYMKGSGDPYLTVQDLISMIYQLKREGIKKIEGDFILDDKDLSFTKRISDLGLIDQADNPSIGALNVEFNRISLYRGQKKLYPPLDNIQLSLESGSNFGQRFKLINEKDQTWIGFKKEMKKSREELPTLDSTMFTGYYFRYLAKVHGIEIPKPKKGKTPKKSKEVAVHKGLPLWRLVSLCLEYSNNLIAETLLKTAVRKSTDKILSEKKSAAILMQAIKENINSKYIGEFYLENGSGITLKNKASARFMTDYLRQIYQFNNLERPFMSHLSINGHSGGLKRLVKIPKHALKIYGKTGSLFYVNNLAGYIMGKNNKVYAFAIFITDPKREKLNNKRNEIQENLLRGAKSWYGSTNLKIEMILKKWLSKY